MADPSSSEPLPYRSGRDAARGEPKLAPPRTVRTWLLLATVWTIGLGVWVVYLVAIGFVVFRVLL